MSPVEIIVLVAAVAVMFVAMGSGFFRGGPVGAKSLRGRLRDRSERHAIERDHDPTFYAPQGGHHPDPPGMRKPPNEGGLL